LYIPIAVTRVNIMLAVSDEKTTLLGKNRLLTFFICIKRAVSVMATMVRYTPIFAQKCTSESVWGDVSASNEPLIS
jgi:hypothetical protein